MSGAHAMPSRDDRGQGSPVWVKNERVVKEETDKA